jgi:ribosome biogenesis GTPase
VRGLDVAALADGCRFRDCRDEREPACAVSVAAHHGRLRATSLKNFRNLQRERELGL